MHAYSLTQRLDDCGHYLWISQFWGFNFTCSYHMLFAWVLELLVLLGDPQKPCHDVLAMFHKVCIMWVLQHNASTKYMCYSSTTNLNGNCCQWQSMCKDELKLAWCKLQTRCSSIHVAFFFYLVTSWQSNQSICISCEPSFCTSHGVFLFVENLQSLLHTCI